MVDFFDLLNKRRSIRDYKDKPVPVQLVREILKDSNLAPSASDGQPWRFIIITDRDLMKRLSDECKKTLVSEIEKNPGSPIGRYETILRDPDFNVFYNAPCVVYILGDSSVRTLEIDCALAAAYFMFSAAARGLGTCWIGLGKQVQDPSLIMEIGLPKDHEIVAPIILGYPEVVPSVPARPDPQVLKVVS